MKLLPIRKGEPYHGRSGTSCYPRKALFDGLLIKTDGDEGDEVVGLAEVVHLLGENWPGLLAFNELPPPAASRTIPVPTKERKRRK